MRSTTTVNMQYSTDNGASWTTFASRPGGSDTGWPTDTAFAAWSAALPADAIGKVIRIRFAFVKSNAVTDYVVSQHAEVGCFIDDITISNSLWLDPKCTTNLAAGTQWFTLDASSAGTALTAGKRFLLRQRSKLGVKWYPFGPVKDITVTGSPLTNFAAWAAYQYPTLTGGFNGDDDGDGANNGAEYAFGTDPLTRNSTSPGTLSVVAGKLRLSHSLPAAASGVAYGAEWSNNLVAWSASGVTVSLAGGVLTAEVPMPPAGRLFLRWVITQQ
jgi:hypothetical protein